MTPCISGFIISCAVTRRLGTRPAIAAGLEEKPWSLERVVEMTAEYLRRKEDAVFKAALAETGLAKSIGSRAAGHVRSHNWSNQKG
jgi:molybdopterin biosynthesis enzyme